jgi:GNAT superfamily N-acetyltransferase
MSTSIVATSSMQHAHSPSDRIEIREAIAGDNHALLALTKVTPMAGKISLRIDRDPDFFALLRARGNPIVYTATFKGLVIGCMSATLHDSYIAGVAEKVAHVGDLKVHPRFSGTRVALRLIKAIDDRLRKEGVDLCLSLMADGNDRALRLTEGRHGTPAVVQAGCFFVEQLLPSPFSKRSGRYRVEEAGVDDLVEIAELLDRQNRRRNFAPLVTVDHLFARCPSDPRKSFRKMLLVRDAGKIVATLTLEDTQDLRQNVLIGLPWSLRVALAVLRCVALPIPRLRIPRAGEPIKTLYVRFMACAEGYEDACKLLIEEARMHTFRQRFTFLSVGLHERDPLRSAVAGALRMTFHSRAMIHARPITTDDGIHDRSQSIAADIFSEDFALV